MIFLFFEILFLSNAYSQPFGPSGVVKVLEAPLLNLPSHSEGVPVDIVKRGEKIYIHPKEVPQSPEYQKQTARFNDGGVVDGWDQQGFFKTLDSTGTDAYIEKRFVKIIYNDRREFATFIRDFEHDHTDYRLEEPIPEQYPFFDHTDKKAEVAIVTGPSKRTAYPYPINSLREDYGRRMGIVANTTRRISDDQEDRFYFGTQGHLTYQSTDIYFSDNDARSRESIGQIGIGPWASFNFYRTHSIRLNISGGISLNYHRALVEIRDRELLETRLFDGLSVTPKLAGQFIRPQFFPAADLVIGVETQFNVSQRLSAKDRGGEVSRFWGENDKSYMISPGGIFAFTIGIQTSY